MRENSFFTHLNYDVRCMIFDLLDLPPISHDSLGLVLSCRKAVDETEQAAVRGLNRRFASIIATTARKDPIPPPSKFPHSASFADMGRITITVGWEYMCEPFRNVAFLEEVLSYYFSEVTIVCKTAEKSQALTDTASVQTHDARDFMLMAFLGQNFRWKAEYTICRILEHIEMYQRHYRHPGNPYASSTEIPTRTKKIVFSYGNVDENSGGFECLKVQYSDKFKEIMRREGGMDVAAYSWPTLVQYRRDEEGGMMSISSGERWVNRVNGSGLYHAWTDEELRQG
ncbi:hypothetical protein CC86DRAFT_369987 [Ophiobolus disseminans]|uniref:Uncharacterized protein n=1 Tax=Ophiobolus disseminans TaxID=1469910 RepID=A0A6A7A0K0_9PLEO|nr:hypothetical protein CC86DRAFT_369987 [Ophiobolus disseminans]